MNLEGRFIKVINDNIVSHYGIKNGDYLLFSHMEGTFQYWGDYYDKHGYFGSSITTAFELMPEGFIPEKYYSSSKSKLPTQINYEIY
jgi:hypothetical protein